MIEEHDEAVGAEDDRVCFEATHEPTERVARRRALEAERGELEAAAVERDEQSLELVGEIVTCCGVPRRTREGTEQLVGFVFRETRREQLA